MIEKFMLAYCVISVLSLIGWAAICRVGRVWEDGNEETPQKQA